jgi:hypothetical protein
MMLEVLVLAGARQSGLMWYISLSVLWAGFVGFFGFPSVLGFSGVFLILLSVLVSFCILYVCLGAPLRFLWNSLFTYIKKTISNDSKIVFDKHSLITSTKVIVDKHSSATTKAEPPQISCLLSLLMLFSHFLCYSIILAVIMQGCIYPYGL